MDFFHLLPTDLIPCFHGNTLGKTRCLSLLHLLFNKIYSENKLQLANLFISHPAFEPRKKSKKRRLIIAKKAKKISKKIQNFSEKLADQSKTRPSSCAYKTSAAEPLNLCQCKERTGELFLCRSVTHI